MCWIYWLPIFKGVLVIEDTILLDINNIGLKHKDKLITYSNIFGLLLPRVRGFWYGFVGVCSLTYCNGNFRFTRVSELLIVILSKKLL